jgi:carbon monoxide dehydrogenase subunit G
MEVNKLQKKIAEREFLLNTTPMRVWELLGQALLNSPLGLEKIEVLDENHVRAESTIKIAFVRLVTQLMVVFLEMDEPKRMVADLNAKTLRGLVNLNQRIVIDLNPLNQRQTKVTCEVSAQDNNPLVFALISRRVKSVAEMTLEGIEQTLKRFA